MKTNDETQLKNLATNLDSMLKTIEQQCQTIRWRLANYPAALAVLDLETDIGILTAEACKVATLYGELKALAVPEDAQDSPLPSHPDVEGSTGPMPAPGLAGNTPAAMTYDVIQLLDDTEIVEAQCGGEYPTFEAAKAAAIDYMEDVIALCELKLDELRDADTAERYFGTELATNDLSETEVNVQFVSPDAYPPDPEVQGKPLPWFVGKTVKLRFPAPRGPMKSELMWVAVTSIRRDELVGTLDSEPLFADLCCSDEIIFRREDILVVFEGGLADQQG